MFTANVQWMGAHGRIIHTHDLNSFEKVFFFFKVLEVGAEPFPRSVISGGRNKTSQGALLEWRPLKLTGISVCKVFVTGRMSSVFSSMIQRKRG